ncbi:hypothetical protein EV385_4462 [Krasilnikovia cinnamomea]|uniref:Uncharacterized protein n=1 Tax=Krasilnikovia cinnamomea TaxID=349313 RepID=A0A4Q7ZNH6_9ACTN|nr:hypothetical protein EV385_4462 [Krasilnikovia cinnamomea]
MTRTIRSRRAPARQQAPLYARLLRLEHLAPSGFLCFVFLEGSVALAILLALAELVSWWGVLVLPVTVAAMVKLNDLIAGAVSRAATAPDPLGGPRSARGERRTGPTLRSAVAPPPADGPMIWTPPHAELPAFDEGGSIFDDPEPAYREAGLGFEEARQEYGYEDHEPAAADAGAGYESAEPEYEDAGFTYGDAGLGRYGPVDLRARVEAARAAIQTAEPVDSSPFDAAPRYAAALNDAPTTRLWADQLDAEQRARQSASHHYE